MPALLGVGEPRCSPHRPPTPSAIEQDAGEQDRCCGTAAGRIRRREDRGRTREQEHGEQAQGIDAEQRGELHHSAAAEQAHSRRGSREARSEHGRGHTRRDRRRWRARTRRPIPGHHISMASVDGRDEEQRHAGGKRRHDERDQPAVPPRLDEEGLGDPIESGEEIAEAEPKPDQAGAFRAAAPRR